MPFLFDAATGRYRDSDTGRLVSEARVRLAVDAAADTASEHLAHLSARLLSGELRLSEWQMEAMRTIRLGHVAAGVVAHGGRAKMTPADWGFIGRRIRDEYGYLRDFANGIEAGAVPLDGRIAARAALYGQGIRPTFEAMRSRDAAGYGYQAERSVMHPAEHCSECVNEAGRGWVELGSIVPIGSRQCLANCHCTIARRPAPARRHLRAVS
jgi:hypothetical protein